MMTTMKKFVIAVLIATLLLPASVGALLLAQDASDAPAAPTERREAVATRALAFLNAYASRDVDTLWPLLSESSKTQLEGDLNELKETLQLIPEDRRSNALDGLSVTANDILAMRSGREFLRWLLSEVADNELELVRYLTIDASGVEIEGTRAKLTWRIREDGNEDAAYLIRQMPQEAIFENDAWCLIVMAE